MPILKGSLDNVPKDTVRLSESDAIDYQEKMMDCWEPSYEMWPLKYGSVFLAGACGASVFATSEKFRKLCFLAKYSRLMIGIPTATLTSLGVLLLQSKVRQLLNEKTVCGSNTVGTGERRLLPRIFYWPKHCAQVAFKRDLQCSKDFWDQFTRHFSCLVAVPCSLKA